MALILNIETATTLCSVAVSDGEKVLAMKEADEGYTHAENLHVFIEAVLKEAGIGVKQLNAVAVGKGPGSYTGLRIGASAAKGLAYALSIPLIAVNTLETMAYSVAKDVEADALFCPMLDARRMEVYCAVYGRDLKHIKETSAQIIEENNPGYFRFDKPVYFFGDGMPKCKELLSTLTNSVFIEPVKPSANFLADLALKRYKDNSFENAAYFEPFYLKDFMVKR